VNTLHGGFSPLRAGQDHVLTMRMNENTDRMSELIASSFDGTRAGSRLAASRPGSALQRSRPQSAMSGCSSMQHRVQRGGAFRPSSVLSERSECSNLRPQSAAPQAKGTHRAADHGMHEAEQGVTRYPMWDGDGTGEELEAEKTVFVSNAPMSSYAHAFSMRNTRWSAPPRDQLFRQRIPDKRKDLSASFQKPKQIFGLSSARTRQVEEMSQTSSQAAKEVPPLRVDFLLRQLRLLCYRKVKGNGSDVSVREIFRHFDSNKDEDEDGAGIDVDEFTSALRKLMLGTPEDGLVSSEEAACMFRKIDTNNGGTIDYREVAQLLSQPGWDHRLVGKRSNVLL
jgi:hypothetical protein